tara:strand:+ start:802 stop:1668 length:867 start_codon:yes stop_codon:yes gene_type:complete
MTQQDVSEVSVHINDTAVTVAQGTTLLQAARLAGVEIPTLCWAENLTPVNACRLCVVEQEGTRALIPSCSRLCEDGIRVETDSDRVRHSRRMILEFLASTNDLSQSAELQEWAESYQIDLDRYISPEKNNDDVKIEDDLFVRAYDRCVLCYKCVEACGDDAQHSFAIAIAGRGFDARVSTEYEVELPESACVYCGNCVGVCPTNALQFKVEFDLRESDEWRPEDQSTTETICSYCGVGCSLELHTQNNQIVKVTSPSDHSVTSGHLCIKGRFGWQYVHAPKYEPSKKS